MCPKGFTLRFKFWIGRVASLPFANHPLLVNNRAIDCLCQKHKICLSKQHMDGTAKTNVLYLVREVCYSMQISFY